MDEDRSNSSSPSSSKHRDSSLIDFEEENQERAASIRSRGGKGKNAARSKGKDKEHNRFYIDEATETQSDENENVDSATGVTDEDESNDIDEDELDEGDIKVRQETMNEIHLFGLPIWKAALYKKSRSVTRAAFLALHSKPKQSRSLMANPGNILWFLLVGWWLGLMTVVHGIIMYIIPFGGKEYGRVLWELGWYMFWPFGRRVERIKLSQRGGDIEEQLVDGSQEAGRGTSLDSRGSVAVDLENEQLLLQNSRNGRYGRRTSGILLGKIVYYIFYITKFGPTYLAISLLSWLCVFSIPMGKLTLTLLKYMWRDPLSLHFILDEDARRQDPQEEAEANSKTLLCTNEAFGFYYYKYTVDGVNIIFINLLSVVVGVLVLAFVVGPITDHKSPLTQPGLLFSLCLVATIPLAYFIGQAVSSISAQSSFGMGAVINATFGSIIEVILYSMALAQGKLELVQGSLIGSFLAGMLLMPGVSMIAGGIKSKEQRFNAKSAGVTATLIIMGMIGSFAPTIFYHTFGNSEILCEQNNENTFGMKHGKQYVSMGRCVQRPLHPVKDQFFLTTVRPFTYFCAAVLLGSYLVALWFALNTHAAHIYSQNISINDRVEGLWRTLKRLVQLNAKENSPIHLGLTDSEFGSQTKQRVTFSSAEPHSHISGIKKRAGHTTDSPILPSPSVVKLSQMKPIYAADPEDQLPDQDVLEWKSEQQGGGHHDAPNWSKTKSALILCLCTLAFSLIAEVLVDTVDVVISGAGFSEKFLGMTLFALVPSVTEFVNAIAFAIQHNISLALEICNAYTVQVSLLQIPALLFLSSVFISPSPSSAALSNSSTQLRPTFMLQYFVNLIKDPTLSPLDLAYHNLLRPASSSIARVGDSLTFDNANYIFTLIFSRWDLVASIFSVFLLTYVLIEGKSNYFKGSILCFSYFVWLVSFYLAPSDYVVSN